MAPDLEEKLKICGWTPMRRVDDSQVNDWLRAAVQTYGCHVFPEAVRILREFGGLFLAGACSPLHVHPIFGNGQLDVPEEWFLWEWVIEQVLFPIASDTYLTAFAVAPDGKIYSNGISGLFFWGDSFEEMLHIYFNNYKSIEMVEVIKTRMNEAVEEEAMKIYRVIKP